MYTLEHILRLCEKRISDTLISPDAFQAICQVASSFPITLSRFMGFECRLNVPSTDAGFAFNVLSDSPGWAIMAGADALYRLPDACLEQTTWQRLSSLCQQTLDDASPLYQSLSTLWLEFDIDQNLVGIPVPDVFISSSDDPQPRRTQSAKPGLQLLFENLLGSPPSPQLMHNVRRCIQMPRYEGMFNQLAVLMGRRGQAIRAVMTFKLLDSCLAFVNALGWIGNAVELKAQIGWTAGIVDEYRLQIDFTDDPYCMIVPRIGIEPCFENDGYARNDPRWVPLLDGFVKEGQCVPEKRDALLDFCGQSYEILALPLIVQRGLSHAKFVCTPGNPLETKIYFGVIQHPHLILQRT
jgi:hypothetical protein